MGEISIGVNPAALKLWSNGRSSAQSPEQPQGITASFSLWWGLLTWAVAAGPHFGVSALYLLEMLISGMSAKQESCVQEG